MGIRAIFLVIAVSLLACSKNPRYDSEPCAHAAIVDYDQYMNASSANYTITNVALHGDCLDVTYSSTGCSGAYWVTELYDAGVLALSLPPQRMLRLKLTNNELCTAVISRTNTFDVSKLRVSGENRVYLVVAGANKMVLYEY